MLTQLRGERRERAKWTKKGNDGGRKQRGCKDNALEMCKRAREQTKTVQRSTKSQVAEGHGDI